MRESLLNALDGHAATFMSILKAEQVRPVLSQVLYRPYL